MIKRFGQHDRSGGIRDVFGASPNFEFQYNRGSSAFKLPNALHAWNYKNATDVGTTVTSVDKGSVGGLNATNPDAASEPTLTSSGIVYDGVSEFLQKLTSNFRGNDDSGVVHILVDFTSDGNNQQFFSLANNTVSNERMGWGIGSGNTIQYFIDLGGSITVLRTTSSILNGKRVLSYYCTGSDCFIAIDGIKQTSYALDTIGGNWIKASITGGNSYNNIAFSSVQRSTPDYYATKILDIEYTPYTNEANVLTDALLIKNNVS